MAADLEFAPGSERAYRRENGVDPYGDRMLSPRSAMEAISITVRQPLESHSNASETDVLHLFLRVLGRVVNRFATSFDVLARTGYRVTTRHSAKRGEQAEHH